MSGSNVPLTLLDVTHPREWPAGAWVSDVVPHLAYGITAHAAYELMRRPRPGGFCRSRGA
ncbi:hypothetical protein [Nonomuraea sp. NPDC052265]|uniref:hypothetical protein n=1 Tax=Nonomuraea sp. NPDC052265 TaxID=3364374 RepID=UPI0037C746B2